MGGVGAAAPLSAALSFARVRVLVTLASFTFLPCAWALAVFRSTQALRTGEVTSAAADRAFLGVMGAATSALFVCSAYFDDAPEPAFLGCAALLVIAFWAATRLSASAWPAPENANLAWWNSRASASHSRASQMSPASGVAAATGDRKAGIGSQPGTRPPATFIAALRLET